jgi:hypothetical protein
MEPTAAQQAEEKPIRSAVVSSPEQTLPPQGLSDQSSSPVGFGLPCSSCRAYYPADLPACPICKSTHRVSANQVTARPTVLPGTQPASSSSIDDQREQYLKELKSQAFASHTQIGAAASFRCVLEHQHQGSAEPAAVCQTCYGELRQAADRMEAALRIDTKEAAKIVYDAVWADTSDPNGTYLNAAAALLSELRQRAGISLLFGSNQPLPH